MGAWPSVLLLHGFTDSGPDHWESWLAGELARRGAIVDVPQFSDPGQPRIEVWLAELREHLDVTAPAVERVVLAYFTGAALWLHHAAAGCDRRQRVGHVLLVAPPGPRWHAPYVHGFVPVPLDAAGLRRAAGSTRLVVGSDDPDCTVAEAAAMADALRIDLDIIPRGGRLNAAAGYGPWPAVFDWVRDAAVPLAGRR